MRMAAGDDANAELARIYLELLDGRVAAATTAAGAMAARLRADPSWWVRFYAINALIIVAIGADELRDPARAVTALRSALALLEDPHFPTSATWIRRRIERAHAMLARHLAPSDRAAALPLAEAALAWYRRAGGYDAIVAELATITGSH
jgi:hypothetical protein